MKNLNTYALLPLLFSGLFLSPLHALADQAVNQTSDQTQETQDNSDASTGGFYIGGMGSILSMKMTENWYFAETPITDDQRAHGYALGAFMGYQFGSYFATEIGGQYWKSTSTNSSAGNGYFALKGIIPLGNTADIYGKAGVSLEPDLAGLFAVGADYKITNHWSIGPELTRLCSSGVDPISVLTNGHTFVDLYTIQTSYRF